MQRQKFYLFKRSGIWYIGYRDGGRVRWKSTHARLKTDALEAVTEFEKLRAQEKPCVTLGEFRREFLLLQGGNLRMKTREVYESAFRDFKSICGDKFLPAYTLDDVENFKATRLRTCKPTSVNIRFRALRAAFNLAVKWGLLASSPFSLSSQVKIAERLPVYVTREDFVKITEATKEMMLRDVWLFAFLTGCRLSEILNLKWKNVDLERRQVLVTSDESFQTKTGRSRVVPANETVYSMLLRRSYDNTEYVFHRRGYKLPKDFVTHKFKAAVREAQLSEEIHFHSLRHSFATLLTQAGVPIFSVSKLLGHSSVKVTEIYSHLAASELQDEVNKLHVALN